MILMKIGSGSTQIKGDCKMTGFADYFTCESVSFGITREILDSSKSGTADITFGVGELGEVSVSKSMDMGSPQLATYAMRGATMGDIELKFVQISTDSSNKTKAIVFLHIFLQNGFIKTWNISGDADGRPTEDVTLWYNGIAFTWYYSSDGKVYSKATPEFAWDHIKNKPWADGKTKLLTNTTCIVDVGDSG